MISSDETKIGHLGSGEHKWAWKRADEGLSSRLVNKTLRFGVSLIMWSYMTWEGVAFATKIDGKTNEDPYLHTLKVEL